MRMHSKDAKSYIICRLTPKYGQDERVERKRGERGEEEVRPADTPKKKQKNPREIGPKNVNSRVKKGWWMNGWLDIGREWKRELFTISEGNNKTMDLSINKGKQRQPYRKNTVYFFESFFSPSFFLCCLFCILPETLQQIILYVRKYTTSWAEQQSVAFEKAEKREYMLIKSSWINYILHKVSVLHYDFISLGKRMQQPNP